MSKTLIISTSLAASEEQAREERERLGLKERSCGAVFDGDLLNL
jgi:hypothetical protein